MVSATRRLVFHPLRCPCSTCTMWVISFSFLYPSHVLYSPINTICIGASATSTSSTRTAHPPSLRYAHVPRNPSANIQLTMPHTLPAPVHPLILPPPLSHQSASLSGIALDLENRRTAPTPTSSTTSGQAVFRQGSPGTPNRRPTVFA